MIASIATINYSTNQKRRNGDDNDVNHESCQSPALQNKNKNFREKILHEDKKIIYSERDDNRRVDAVFVADIASYAKEIQKVCIRENIGMPLRTKSENFSLIQALSSFVL